MNFEVLLLRKIDRQGMHCWSNSEMGMQVLMETLTVPFEVLDLPLVSFRGLLGLERSQIATLSRLGIFLPGIDPVLARG